MQQHTDFDSPPLDGAPTEPELIQAAQRLHQVQVRLRWGINLILMISVFPLSLWNLHREIQLWLEYFTWTAVRYGLGFNPWAALGLLICIAFVTSTLVWQTRNILWGLPQSELYRLRQRALRIHQKGQRSLLWKWVWG